MLLVFFPCSTLNMFLEILTANVGMRTWLQFTVIPSLQDKKKQDLLNILLWKVDQAIIDLVGLKEEFAATQT